MKILVYGINYYPELTGIGKYTGEMCSWLAQNGHSVEVITAMPFYPNWEVKKEYQGKWWHTEVIDSVTVHRVPLYVPKQVTGKTRILHELSFGAASAIYWLICFLKQYDAIISPCPPLQIGVYPWLYKIFYPKTNWVFHIQDLQVDAAKDLGLIKNKKLLAVLEKIEKFFLKKATTVSSISDGMIRKIAQKGIVEEKNIAFFPNWTDVSHLKPMPQQRTEYKRHYALDPNKKLFLYSGNIGEKQGIDEILLAAKYLQDEGTNEAQFFIVGNGASKNRIVAMAKELGLSNVLFGDLVPLEELPLLLNAADFHLVLQKSGATDLVMPSKLTNILAVGGVSLVTADEHANLRILVEKYNMGFTSDAEKTGDLVAMICAALGAGASDTDTKSKNAHAYANEFLDKENILANFVRILFESRTPS